MAATLDGQLVVAISSRALFDFEEENQIFEAGMTAEPPPGVKKDAAYMKLQLERLDVPAKQGVAFPLVKKLLAFNTPEAHRVEVVILSKNDPVSGLRVFRSAQREGLRVERGVFTRGRQPYKYLDALRANLFLSANEQGRPALITFLTAGFPTLEEAPALLKVMAEQSDVFELGVPFSDPVGEGPVIQESSYIALSNGVTPAMCFDFVGQLRAEGVTTPVVLMGYYNPIMAMGEDEYCKRAAGCGADGLIVVDLPAEEAER